MFVQAPDVSNRMYCFPSYRTPLIFVRDFFNFYSIKQRAFKYSMGVQSLRSGHLFSIELQGTTTEWIALFHGKRVLSGTFKT